MTIESLEEYLANAAAEFTKELADAGINARAFFGNGSNYIQVEVDGHCMDDHTMCDKLMYERHNLWCVREENKKFTKSGNAYYKAIHVYEPIEK